MRIAILSFVLAFGAPQLAAQDSLLARTLEANRYPVLLVDGRLEGAGGDLLIREGAAARFVGLGEEHGIAEFPGEPFTALLLPNGWTLFDLRPLRAVLHDNRRRIEVPERLFELAFNFDAMLVVQGATPSAPFEGVLEALRGMR